MRVRIDPATFAACCAAHGTTAGRQDRHNIFFSQPRTICLDGSYAYAIALFRPGLKSDGVESKQYGVRVAVTKGVCIVDHRPRFSTLSARYDDFLFAPVCEEANGMRLSVLSALARMNVDPWEEATRLAGMPKAIAEKALVSILDLASGRSWKPPEAQAVAARLVRLLPQPGEAATIAATATAKAPAQRTSYWWVWLAFALAMSFMTPHHQATTTTAPAVTSQSGATVPLKSSTPVPDAVGLSR